MAQVWPFHRWGYRNPHCRTCKTCGSVQMRYMSTLTGRLWWEDQYQKVPFFCTGPDKETKE